ncbi:putative toxin-antitoxin system toxin component, PIN family [Rhodoferax sp.]|uniref:putative toxin-antitoxin system toxin component, PIN family n=1 Tax=Rhodoferax sp. TaxID=50421 RepID=UPI0026161763|nr:putative toxin-antitoxin system toxin component, PIN family [Rhodoferax sp.]MDD5001281.1 putative toxin-antitoxin system toxin component, PIN family [Thiomonas arsenitoxydans]MDD5481217.1 putative toxin-antitoxin system toxin component, PIN family [Rhodoferax sp.]
MPSHSQFPIAVTPVVLDTNIVLDAFVFDDPAARPLKQAMAAHQLQWVATKAMRDELARVLAYPKVTPRMSFYGVTAAHVLAQFDGQTEWVDTAAKAPTTCKDPDDQKFIDLAVAHQALLLSKDNAVLCMKKRLAALGVTVAQRLPQELRATLAVASPVVFQFPA